MYPQKLIFKDLNYEKILTYKDKKCLEENFLDRKKVKTRINLSSNITSFTIDNFYRDETREVSPLIIFGSNNRVIPKGYENIFRSKIANHYFVKIDNASHPLMYEKPDQLNKIMEDYLIG